MIKILDKVLFGITLILMLMSVLAITAIHVHFFNTSKYSFSFTPTGFDTYLLSYSEYKALFTGTIAVIAAYIGLHRVKATTDANMEKVKQDKFNEWKTVLDVRIIEVEKENPYMKREFIRVRSNYYEQLFHIDFKIQTKEELNQIFNSTFRDLVLFFEQQNNKHIEMGEVYPNNQYSYSFDSFRFLFLGCIYDYYDNIEKDLEELYLKMLPKDRSIDEETYKAALSRYRAFL